MTGQALFIAELAIYAWILYNLWKHDKENHKSGVITEPMKRERNQKNVITLYGQVLTFGVETAANIYIMVNIAKSKAEVSFYPITIIVSSTIISVIQLATSHEMRRFLKNRFDLFWRIYIWSNNLGFNKKIDYFSMGNSRVFFYKLSLMNSYFSFVLSFEYLMLCFTEKYFVINHDKENYSFIKYSCLFELLRRVK